MRTAPALVVLSCIALATLCSCSDNARDGERVVELKLAEKDAFVAAKLADLAARAPQQGFTRVRSYDHALFMDVEGATVGFYPQGDKMMLHVALSSPYRLPKVERESTLANLRARAELLWNSTAKDRVRAPTSSTKVAWRDVQSPAG